MAVKDGLPATDFSRMNREYIKAKIEEAGGGSGGGGLPEITEADGGKVLTVESGEAAWAAGGGGGGAAVEYTVTEEETYDELTIQMSAGALLDLCMSGPVSIYFQEGETKYTTPILRAGYSAIQGGYNFYVMYGGDASGIVPFTSSDANEKPIYRDTY